MIQPRHATMSWGDKIWRNSIQPRRSLTLWKVIHNKLPTEKTLQIKGFSIASCCRVCFKAEETVVHLFFQCNFAQTIWSRLEEVFHVKIRRDNIRDLLDSAFKCCISKQVFNLWISGVISVFWLNWKIRNETIFQGKTTST